MRALLLWLVEWLSGENVGGLKESLRITTERSRELEAAFRKVQELLAPGEDWHSWQRVYQDTERVLKVARAADRLNQCVAEFPGRCDACSEYFDALHDALEECQGTRTHAIHEERQRLWQADQARGNQ